MEYCFYNIDYLKGNVKKNLLSWDIFFGKNFLV